MSPGPRGCDLRYWVTQGKLAWLDPIDPALPLRPGPPEAFPYADIVGHSIAEFHRLTPKWIDNPALATSYKIYWRGPEGCLYR
jgi:hypothetical protein